MTLLDSLNPNYLILALLGMTIHVLTKIYTRKDQETKISLKIFLLDSMNWVRIGISFFSVVAILLMSDDIANMFNINLSDHLPAKNVMAFLSGYLNHSIIRSLLKIIKNKI